MICPDFFGCSGKLSFSETRLLASASGHPDAGTDFSKLVTEGTIVSSIDRVHRCARDWDRFARIALNHAFGDVLCAGATPVQAMLSFEFGIDTPEGEYAACSKAFARELATRGVALGKCHSGRTDGVTAVTIATLAARPSRLTQKLQIGSIYLSRPIGALKLQYLSEIGIEIEAGGTLRLLERPDDDVFHGVSWDLLTDISGHGMLGAVAQVAQDHALEVDLCLAPRHAITPEVLSLPVECLQNLPDSYGFPLNAPDPAAELLATLRETAGPFLGFIEDASVHAYATTELGIPVGRYRRGEWKVDISWTE